MSAATARRGRLARDREGLAMSKPPDEPEVTTYFQLQRNRDGLPEVGERVIGGDISQLPPLPANSPWSAQNVTPDEPTIDRSIEDGPTIDINQER
jgi:hypothetical protein